MKLMIAELRKNKAVSQQELATVMGVAHQTVSKWENNVTFPDITLLPQLPQHFDVSVDEFKTASKIDDLVYEISLYIRNLEHLSKFIMNLEKQEYIIRVERIMRREY